VIGVGLGLLRLSPSAFWAMSMSEFTAAASILLGHSHGTDVPSRRALSELMQRYPDRR
jgi:uncharacterized phage protein (TIGR02216 family)